MAPVLRVPFGWKDDRLYEPRQVPNGKACGCVCPACQRSLIARQNHQTPHFAHAPGEDCAKALETAVHLAAKQLIAERQELRLAVLRYFNPYHSGGTVQDLYVERVIQADTVTLEFWLGEMRPDIVVTRGAETYLVEIAVTHFVDDAKMAKIQARQLPTLEIDVSALKKQFTFAALTELLYATQPYPATWLYHPRREELAREAHQEYLAELAAQEAAHEAHKAQQRQQDAEQAARSKRYRQYRDMPLARKLALNLRKLGLTQTQLQELTSRVPFEETFHTPREIWQSAVLLYLARQQAEQDELVGRRLQAMLAPKNCLSWLELTFPVDPANDDEKHAVAFWKYVHFLIGLGVINKEPSGDYYLNLPPEIWGQLRARQKGTPISRPVSSER